MSFRMNSSYTNGVGYNNGNSHHAASAPTGLKVVIAGAGIGGFTAAIALRQQGHDVELYEQSRFADEIGAAIHMVPNAVGLLQRLGVHLEEEGAVELERTRLLKYSGELLSTTDNVTTGTRWQNKWFLAHRAHLHKHLKAVATSVDGKGRPVQVHTSSKIAKVDPHTATMVLQDGTEVRGDVIVGADGVHSVTRLAVTDKEFRPFKTNHSALRFLITKASALADPVTHDFATSNGSMDMWYGPDRKVVLYPCANNTLFNFVCIHPAVLSDASDNYNQTGSRNKLLEIYREFEPRAFHLLEKAETETLKVYPLFDMETLPAFVNDRLALIGDAAHPFTPHLGQGGAMAIEDAFSLGVMLPAGTTPDEIPERLKLYNKARYERASTIQNYSRIVGGDGIKKDASAVEFKLHDFMDYGLSHDEYHASTQILCEHQWQRERSLYWRQPTVFGPMPGPRQDFQGHSHMSTASSSSSVTATIEFKTSATLLRTLFPNSSYKFTKTDTVALASFSVQTLKNMAWLAGGSYDLLGFYIHDVEYTTRSGETLRGSFCPVMFENLTDPILSGREELGYPKVFSDISISTGNEDGARTCEARIAWRGAEWASFRWRGLSAKSPPPPPLTQAAHISTNGDSPQSNSHSDQSDNENRMDQGLFVHKCVPASDETERGKRRADAEYDVFIPSFGTGGISLTTVQKADDAEFKIEDLGFNKLPTLHHIVSRLAEIPIFEIVEATIVDAVGVGDLSGARRIE